jgi:hypothetical protein
MILEVVQDDLSCRDKHGEVGATAEKDLKRESFLPREATKASLPGALVPVGAMRMSRIAPVPKGRFIHSPSDNANKLVYKNKKSVLTKFQKFKVLHT